MSGYEVGSAYVRIRPQMSSFRAETQSGIKSAFSTVGKVILPTLAFAGVTEAVRKSVQQAEIKQVITGQLKNAFATAGLSYREYASVVDTTISRQEKLGFTFDESAQALGRSVRATRSVALATKLQAVAADLARGQNIGLLQATTILVRAYNGQTSGLKRLGVETAKHAKGVAVLDAVEKRFAGSAGKYADTAAGSQARLSAAIEETQALIGSALTPAVGRLNTRLADWLNNSEHQKEIQRNVNEVVRVGGVVVHDLASAFDVLKGPVESIVKNLGGFENVVQKALVIGLALKARSAFGAISSVAAASRTMGDTLASESQVGSAALAKTAASGQRSAGLLDRAFLRVGQRLAGIAVASGRTATKIAADARRESAALATVGVAASRTAGKNVPSLAGASPASIKTVTAAGALEAAALENTLTDLSQATTDFVDTSTSSTAQYVKQGLDSIARVQTSLSASATTAERSLTGVGVAVTGMSGAVVTGLEKETAAVDGLGFAATNTTKKVGAMQGLLGRTLVRAGGGQAAAEGALEKNLLTGAGLKGIVGRVGLLASRATSIGLGAYIANSLIQGLTGFDVAGTVFKGIRNSFKTPPTPTQKAFGRAGALARSAPSTALDELRLAHVQAELTVKADRLALSQENAARTSLQWQEKSLTLTTDLTKLTAAVDALRGAQRKQRGADQAQLAGIVAVGKATTDSQLKLASGFKAASDEGKYATGLYNKLGGALYETASGAKAAATAGLGFADALRKATAADSALTPLQQHNNELVSEFAIAIGRVPTKRETRLIIRNKDALASLQDVANKYALLKRELAKGLGLLVNVFGAQPNGPHDLPLPGAVNLANAPKTLSFSKATLLKRAYEQAEATGAIPAIKAAAAAYLNYVNDALAFVKAEKPHTNKQRALLNQEFDSLTGLQGQLQSELTGIADTAAAKAKAAADAAARRAAAARARAKAAAARAHRAYLGDIADRESTLRRAASATRAAAIKEAGLARTAVGERAKGEGVVAQARSSPAALVARIKKADDAVIAGYRQAEHDNKLTKAEHRKFKNLRLDAQKQERADVAARLKASKQATDAENRFVTLQETDATRKKNAFSLALGAIDNQVAAAGNDQTKLDAAYGRERKLLNRWIDFDKKRLKLYKGNVDLTQQYKADIQQQRRRLIDLNSAQGKGGGGFSLSDFYGQASADFKEYGSNISTGGLLSPGDFRGLIDGIALLAKKASGGGKKHGHVTVNQVFNDPRDPYAGMRAAQLAAEHLYYGG